MMLTWSAVAVLTFTSVACAQESGGVKPGDHPTYTWQQSLTNGQGVKSLSDLAGRPVVVDFWGTHCGPCVGTAVPMALKMQEKYGDEIQVVLVESQGSNQDQVERFAIGKKWASDRVIWTTEAPFSTGKSWIPCCVVLSNEGEVLFNDNPCSAHQKIEELVDEQLKLAKKGAKGAAPSCIKALADFDAGSFAAAIKSLDTAPEAERAEAQKLQKTLQTRAKAKVARLDWYIGAAQFDKADKLLPVLEKGLAGDDKLAAAVKSSGEKLAAREMAQEREAGKALARVEKLLTGGDIDDTVVKQLKVVATKFPNTIAAKRADHLVAVAQVTLK